MNYSIVIRILMVANKFVLPVGISCYYQSVGKILLELAPFIAAMLSFLD